MIWPRCVTRPPGIHFSTRARPELPTIAPTEAPCQAAGWRKNAGINPRFQRADVMPRLRFTLAHQGLSKQRPILAAPKDSARLQGEALPR